MKRLAAILLVGLIGAGCAVSSSSGQQPSVIVSESTAAPSAAPSASASPTSPATASVAPVPHVAGPIPSAIPAKLAATIPVASPFGMAASAGVIWVTTPAGAVRIDPTTNAISGKVAFGSGNDEIDGVAADADAVWVTDFDANTLVRIDPKTLAVVATIPVGQSPEGVVVAAGAVWVANHRAGTVSRIDPATNQIVATIPAGDAGPSGPQWVASISGSIWVGVPNVSSVVRIDPTTNAVVATVVVPYPAYPCGGFALGSGAVWMSSCFEQTSIARVDPATNAVSSTTDLDSFSGQPFVVDSRVWFPVADYRSASGEPVAGAVLRIDPATNTVDRSVAVDLAFQPGGTVAAGGSIWLADDSGSGRVLRLQDQALR